MTITCPACSSTDVTYRNKKQCYICEDCNTEFIPEQEFRALRVFISYGHDEHASFAQRIAEVIKTRGHLVWFDAERLKPGADWESYIEEGLAWAAEQPGSGRIVLVMTPHSVRRPDGYCLNEIARALDHHLFIIPVMLVWCSPPLSISRIQWLDMQHCISDRNADGRFLSGMNRLMEALEQQNLQFEGQTSFLRENLNPLNFEADIVHYQQWFTGREWVFQKIDKWLQDPSASRLFWITGQPGIGKTAIATRLIQRLPNLAAFHLCRRGNSEKASPRRAVMSIAYQLCTQLPEFAEKLAGMNLFQVLSDPDVNAPALFDTLIVQPLATDIRRPSFPCVILIDGLDEASRDGRNILAEFIANEFIKLPEWIRLIITSRPDPEVTQPLQSWEPWTLETEAGQNREDISHYAGKMLKNLVPDHLISSLTETIVENSEGIFLYAEWVCREITNGRIRPGSSRQFPKGLGGIYAGFFREKLTREEKYQEDILAFKKEIRPVLELVAAAREPFPVSLLSGWLGWTRYDEESFFRKMGSLFNIDPSGCIRPFHASVSDWMGDPAKAGDFFVHGAEGTGKLTGYLWQDYRMLGVNSMSRYGLKHLAFHLVETCRWEDLKTLLGDLEYIRSKCAAKMTFDLVKEYSLALDSLPENQENFRYEKEQSEKLQEYARNLISYTKGETPEIKPLPSTEPWGEVRIMAEGRKITENSSGPDTIRAFAQFLSVESYNLTLFGNHPGYVFQQAYNFTRTGPVHEKAKELISRFGKKGPLLLVKENNLQPFTPFPALVRTFKGHAGHVTGIALSMDGQRFISAGDDHMLKVWNPETGECLKVFEGHTGMVNCVALSADGATAISGSSDHTIRVWDVERGKCKNILEGHSGEIEGICLSADGTIAVSASSDGTVRIWNILTCDCLKVLAEHSGPVLGVTLSSDGKLILSSGRDKTIRVWERESGRMLKILHGHTNSVKGICLTADDRTAVSAGYDKTIRIWEMTSGNCKNVLYGHSGKIEDISISADGKIAVSASLDRTLRIWDTQTGTCIKQFKGHAGFVNAVRITADARKAVSAGEDKTVKLWNVESGTDVLSPEENKFAIYDIRLSPDGKTGVSAGRDTTLKIWNMLNGECLKVLAGHTGWVTRLCFAPDGKTIVSGSNDKTVRIWSLAEGKCLHTLAGHEGWVRSVILSSDGKRVVSGSVDETIRIWDFDTGHCLQVLTGHTGNISSLCMASGNKLISSGHDHTLIVWNLISGKMLKVLKGHGDAVTGIHALPGSEKVVSAGMDNTLRIWDIESGSCDTIATGHRLGMSDFIVTAGGKTAITAGNAENRLYVWDLINCVCLNELSGHTDVIFKLMASRDGKYLLSGSKDNTVRIWNPESGECLGIFSAPGPVYAMSALSERNDFLIGLYSGKVMGLDMLNLV